VSKLSKSSKQTNKKYFNISEVSQRYRSDLSQVKHPIIMLAIRDLFEMHPEGLQISRSGGRKKYHFVCFFRNKCLHYSISQSCFALQMKFPHLAECSEVKGVKKP